MTRDRLVIALDVDGTLFDGHRVAPAAVDAIERAVDRGHTVALVTGRRFETLDEVVPSVLPYCAAVVAEEGAVYVDLGSGAVSLLADPLDPAIVEALRRAGGHDLDVGRVVVGAPRECEDIVRRVAGAVGSSRRVIVNKGSVALSPSGCDKGTGLRALLDRLGTEGPVLAIGDAENDLPLFAAATVAMAVANADVAVRASGVPITRASFGDGVAEAIDHHAG